MPNAVVAGALAGIGLGEPRSEGRLTVVPLTGGPVTPEALSLEPGSDHLGEGFLEVTEVSEAGSVPELRVRNGTDRDLLLLEGEEFVGARQNRVVNATILVAAGTESRLPVSCMEQGRWSWRSRSFRSSGNVMTPGQRRRLSSSVGSSLRTSRGYRSDQGDVWASVREMEERLAAPSATGAMADAYGHAAPDIEEAAARLAIGEGQVGWVVLVGGRPVACDLLASPAAFSRFGARLVRSYLMEARLAGAEEREEEAPAAAGDPVAAARTFLEDVARAEAEARPSAGLGEDLRLRGGRVVGSALVVGERLVQIGAFADGEVAR